MARIAALLLVLVTGAAATPGGGHHLVVLAGRGDRDLATLLARQRDPRSPEHERWISPREFGRRFGARSRDLRRVRRWLRAAGCRIRPFTSRWLVACEGPVALAVPPGLEGIVAEVLDAADAPAVAFNHRTDGLRPALRTGSRWVLSPAELARIYGLDSPGGAFVDGRGRTIGIVGVSALDPADVAAFRARFGLAPIDLEQVGGPRQPGSAGELEATLDVTWAGAVAPGAHIVLAVGAGVVDALAALVDRSDVDVVSLSLAICPGGGARPFITTALRLFRQAAIQGQTVLVASGDRGPRSCPGRGLDPFASSPWITAVGGTTPMPILDSSGVAEGYGTEVAWSEPDAASGGGVSGAPRPRYQRGNAHRTVPDVAFPAAVIYPIGYGGAVRCCIGGTSAAAPAWAGAVARLAELRGRRVGFLNDRLYRLGRAQRRGGPAVFHDVTRGSNAIGGARGFRAHTGYDLVTGWGTIAGPAFFAAFP
ncbi:MAG TPA: S53 family peptidase [Candidatus Binatia bacterium]|nr:S53 family peptidase [Candidatus Binatia bacterium]